MKQKYTCKNCCNNEPCHIIIHSNGDAGSDLIGATAKKQCVVLSSDQTATFVRTK